MYSLIDRMLYVDSNIITSIVCPMTTDNRYNNPVIGSLLTQLHQHRMTQELATFRQLQEERKMHHSLSLIESRRRGLQERKLFNNKTKEGGLIDSQVKPVPYMFIPKYKNDTFIMPDRVFAKGKAGRRFHIKMKDTSIYSLQEPETEAVSEALRKQEKEKTIISRKVEEFNRIVDNADGSKRKQQNSWYLKTRKQFNYAHTGSELFSQCEPLLGPKETEGITRKKVSLAKTFDFSRAWRPNSRKVSSPFTQSFSKSVYHHPHCSSVI